MRTEHNIPAIRSVVNDWRRRGQRIGLIPTMGHIHAGHLSLVEKATLEADRVIVSLFVNPMQFGEGEDYATYPRVFSEDAFRLAESDVHLLFAPEVTELYPRGLDTITRIVVPGITDILCGATRPGHFTGVVTVVNKLFNIVQPHVAVFGEKDYQQLIVIRQMVRDLDIPVDIVSIPTVREDDGLAMSSRNTYLMEDERVRARGLYQVLVETRDAILTGERNFSELENSAMQTLRDGGFQPEYISVRTAKELAMPSEDDRELVILGAAHLGRARLIDNIRFSL